MQTKEEILKEIAANKCCGRCIDGMDECVNHPLLDKLNEIDFMESLGQAIDNADCKITFGLQEHQIKLIEKAINEFGSAHPFVFETVAKEIAWCPKTLACYYINYVRDNQQTLIDEVNRLNLTIEGMVLTITALRKAKDKG